MAVLQNAGRHAITGYKVLRRFGEFASLVECKLSTGRTHQIRVHMAHIGHPIIGDAIYGGGVSRARRAPLNEKISIYIKQLDGQALHAFALGFRHPKTGEQINFSSQLPIEIRELITLLESF
jgi:23S rRNA pseudouridine1911/1915/1917 synthase